MDLTPVITRLREQATDLRFVGGQADLPDPTSYAQRPAAFVYPLTDQPAGNSLVGGVDQRVTVRFGVLLALTNVRRTRAAALPDLEAIRVAVRTALLNWQPTGADDVCVFAGGSLRSLDDSILWWQDDYLTAVHWRKTT